jgi:hypothetical protein
MLPTSGSFWTACGGSTHQLTSRSCVLLQLRASELDEFWLETARTAVKESIATLEEAAKQLITAVTLVEGIYFAAVSFRDLRGAMAGAETWWRIILFVSPIVIWLVCLFFAVRVFTPEIYTTNLCSPDLAEQVYGQIAAYKHRNLKRTHWALLLGFVPLVISIVYYLLPAP